MHHIYTTGRTYNGTQTLDINAPSAGGDDWEHVEVQFRDASRNIDGIVKVFNIELNTPRELGAAVLREYDAGRYTLKGN